MSSVGLLEARGLLDGRTFVGAGFADGSLGAGAEGAGTRLEGTRRPGVTVATATGTSLAADADGVETTGDSAWLALADSAPDSARLVIITVTATPVSVATRARAATRIARPDGRRRDLGAPVLWDVRAQSTA